MPEPDQSTRVQEHRPRRLYREKPLDAIDNKVLHDCLALWATRRGERQFPSRADITLRDLKSSMPYATLLRVFEDGSDFEFRIVGDAIAQAYGANFVGKRLSDFGDSLGNKMGDAYRMVVRSRSPFVIEGWFEQAVGDYFYREVLFLPLGTDDAAVDHILAFGMFVRRDLAQLEDFGISTAPNLDGKGA